MKQELEAKLFEKYPKILNGALVGKHIDCGDGWYHLLDHLCGDIQETCDKDHHITQVQAFDIKTDPTGGLRFYYLGGNLYIYEAVSDAEVKSYSICEECGERGDRTKKRAWAKCLCKGHQDNIR